MHAHACARPTTTELDVRGDALVAPTPTTIRNMCTPCHLFRALGHERVVVAELQIPPERNKAAHTLIAVMVGDASPTPTHPMEAHVPHHHAHGQQPTMTSHGLLLIRRLNCEGQVEAYCSVHDDAIVELQLPLPRA